MFFSMKRSVVVFVALGLLAGLVGCGNSARPVDKSIETEAKQWVTNHYISFWSGGFFQESDVENFTKVCMIELFSTNSSHIEDDDYWQVTKDRIEETKKNPNAIPAKLESYRFRSEGVGGMYECAERELTKIDYENLLGTEFDPPFG
tara:strand:- start:300 stop:740 length:441 start_codon:yes stop_codon:yes gene_type:complete